MEDDIPPHPIPTRTKRARYGQAGHSRKLRPIIDSLSSLEGDDTPWYGVNRRVKSLEDAFEIAIADLTDRADSPAAAHLETLMAAARAALAAQSELFALHRNVCVEALNLRMCV